MPSWKKFHEKEVTHSMAHYLQAIAAESCSTGSASVGDVAQRLAVSRAGVTSMLRSLKSRGLVRHEPYGDVALTEEGVRLATRTEQSRDLLTRFFRTLGVTATTAEEDACMIEHLLSPDSLLELTRLTEFLRRDHPAAAEFREAFAAYQAACTSGDASTDCPICKGRCLRQTLEGVPTPRAPEEASP